MRNGKRLTAITLSLAIMLSLTGCLIRKPSAADGISSPAVTAPEDIWAPYEEPIIITTIMEENSGTAFQGDDDYQNNPW